jgi:hypothetical protein
LITGRNRAKLTFAHELLIRFEKYHAIYYYIVVLLALPLTGKVVALAFLQQVPSFYFRRKLSKSE